MAEIHLGIDVDTADVTAADASLDRFEAKLRGATGTFGGVAGASLRADRGVRGFADATRMAEQRTQRATAEVIRLNTATVGLNRGFGSMRGAVQNAAFQVQDIAVQMQLGATAARALSIQLPQLLGGFGALGAIVGLAAGVAIPFFSESVDKAIASIKGLNAELMQTAAWQAIGDAFRFLRDGEPPTVKPSIADAHLVDGANNRRPTHG